jgi:hypothetical protein
LLVPRPPSPGCTVKLLPAKKHLARLRKSKEWKMLVEKILGQSKQPDQPRVLTAEEKAKLTPAQQLDYVRQFNQAVMPEWKVPERGDELGEGGG